MKPLRTPVALFGLLLPLLLCAAAGAAKPPPDLLTRALGPVHTRTLPNGLRVMVRPRREAPVVTTMLWYRVGSRDETPGATGIAHFLEHLLFKGTRKLAKGEIDRITYRLGGSNNAFTYYDYTAYVFNLPRHAWTKALEIEADRMRNCTFDPREFEAERQVVIEERRGSEDDPVEHFMERVNAVAFLAHPYRNPVIGWMSDLRRLTRAEVVDFYRRYYVPANATLLVAGDVSPEEAFREAERAFRAVPRLPAPARPAPREPEQQEERRLRLRGETGVTRVVLSFPMPGRADARSADRSLLAYALGEGRLSRLNRRLVDAEQLATTVDVYDGAYRDAGQFLVVATAAPGADPLRLEAVLWEELERAAREPFAREEVERARNQYVSGWVRRAETASDLGTILGEADAQVGRERLRAELRRVAAVGPGDLQAAARGLFRRERVTVGLLLPRPAATGGGDGAQKPAPAGRGPGARTAPRPATVSGTPRTGPVLPPLRPLERRLPNGLRLLLLRRADLPTATLTLRVAGGVFHEPEDAGGVAALTARTLQGGAGSRGYEEIAAALEQVGAELDVRPGRAGTVLELSSLSPHLDGLLPVLADVLRRPTFPVGEVAREKAQMLVELQEEADDAFAVGRNAFRRLVYGPHPGSRPDLGTPASVERLTRDDLVRFHGRRYRPENVVIAAAGDFDPARLAERLEALLGDWKSPGEAQDPPLPAPHPPGSARRERIAMNKVQAQILLGHLGIRRSDPDYPALLVMDSILGEGVGGGFTARIPYQLRDVQGLAYTVFASITAGAGSEPGAFLAAMGADPGKVDAAVKGLLAEIRKIRSSPVTPAELREARDYLRNHYVFEFQTNAQLAAYLQMVTEHGLGIDYRTRFPALVGAVTAADVLRVARKHLDPDRAALVVVGPDPKPAPGKSGR